MSSVERDVDVVIDGEANAAVATVTERRELELADLFVDGELRLWQDSTGWNGFTREETDDSVVYYAVNRLQDGNDDRWIGKLRVGERAVEEAVKKHIRDPNAGGRGRFVRRCSPP